MTKKGKKKKIEINSGPIFLPKKAFKVQTKGRNQFFSQFRAHWTLKNSKSVYIRPGYASGKKWPARRKIRKLQSTLGSIFTLSKTSKSGQIN